jgi:hypothetical protein
MNQRQQEHPLLEDDLMLMASEGDEDAIAELTRRGYRTEDW